MKNWLHRHVFTTVLCSLLLAFSGTYAQGQATTATAAPGSFGFAGTEFYVAFPRNADESARHQFMGLVISSEVSTVGTVEIPRIGIVDGYDQVVGVDVQTFTTEPGKVTMIEVPRLVEPLFSEETRDNKRSVHITSRAPVAVYAVNARYQSMAGFPVLPLEQWQTSYIPTALPKQDGNSTSQLIVIASENETEVRIRPGANVTFSNEGWELPKITLNKGEIFYLRAKGDDDGDLSGTSISANRPIGVISGHSRTSISLNGTAGSFQYSSHQLDMMTPEILWGTDYYSVPMRQSGDRFRLMAREGETYVTVRCYRSSGVVQKDVRLRYRGDVMDLSNLDGIPLDGPIYWKSTAPISVMQLRTSNGDYGNPENSPVAMQLVAIKDYGKRSVAATPGIIDGSSFQNNFLTLIARGSADPFASITVNGVAANQMAGNIIRSIDQNVYTITFPVSTGAHTIVSTTQDVTFTGMMTGNNGNIARDVYAWTIPYWMQQEVVDKQAPYVVAASETANKGFDVQLSDRQDAYFSGVDNITIVESPGWEFAASFNRPVPDNDGYASFRSIADPSGPLYVELRDRDGNTARVTITDGVCIATATIEEENVMINVIEGNTGWGDVDVHANLCGDEAHIEDVQFSLSSPALPYLDIILPAPASLPLTILPNQAVPIRIEVRDGLAPGMYVTHLRIIVDGTEMNIPVTIVVDTKSDVGSEGKEGTDVAAVIYPNPSLSEVTIEFSRPLGATARIVIADAMGRIVRTFGSDIVGNTEKLQWDGNGVGGVHLPAGLYLVSLFDGKKNSALVQSVTLIR